MAPVEDESGWMVTEAVRYAEHLAADDPSLEGGELLSDAKTFHDGPPRC